MALLGVILIVLIGVAIFKETSKKRQVQKQIDELKAQARQIEQENAKLSDKNDYFGSADFTQKEAKDKFNLQSPQENVVIIKPTLSPKTDDKQEESSADKKLTVNLSNLEKWWNYFFKP